MVSRYVILALLATPAFAQTLPDWMVEAAEYTDDPAQIALGKPLYAEHCAACHGENLEGAENWRERNDDGTFPAPPHDESGHTWHHADQLLFDYTRLGGEQAMAAAGVTNFNSGMPGFGDVISDAEIRAVLAFIKSTWPDEQRKAQAQMTAADERRRDATREKVSE